MAVHGVLPANLPPAAVLPVSSMGTVGAPGFTGGLLPFMFGQPVCPGAQTWAKGSAIGEAGAVQWPVVPGSKFLGIVGTAVGPPYVPRSLPVPGLPTTAAGPPRCKSISPVPPTLTAAASSEL